MGKAVLAQWSATAVVGLVSILLSIYIARALGPDSFGIYSVAFAFGSIYVIFVDGGFKSLIFREGTSRSVEFKIGLEQLNKLSLANSTFILLICLFLSLVALSGKNATIASAALICFYFLGLIQIASANLRALGQFVDDANLQIKSRLLSAFGISALLIAGFYDIGLIFFAWAVCSFVVLITYRRFWSSPSLKGIVATYKASAPFLFLELAITVYLRSDTILLSAFGIKSDQIGQFSAAFKVCEAVVMFSMPFGLLLFRNFRLTQRQQAETKRIIGNLLTIGLVIGALLSLLTYKFSTQIIELLFGKKYFESGSYLSTLAPFILFILPNMILNQFMLATGRERLCLLVALIAAVTHLALSAYFIPIFGISAPLVLKVMTEGLVFALLGVTTFYFVSRSG